MLKQLITLFVLASTTIATPITDPNSVSLITRQQSSEVNGIFVWFPNPRYSGTANFTNVDNEEPNYCHQFQPAIQGRVAFRSYLLDKSLFTAWTNANCAGTPAFSDGSNTPKQVPDVDVRNLLSFQIRYRA